MNIEQQIETLQAQLNELREQCKQQPEFEYPRYRQSIQSKSVVKFTDLTAGGVVVASKFSLDHSIGYRSSDWFPHTDTSKWQPIAFDEDRRIADKQLCECWDTGYTHSRVIRFYDAKNKRSFCYEGERSGMTYDNYRPIPYADYPDWAIEAEKTLKD